MKTLQGQNTQQPDWSKAPEGATHYRVNKRVYWYKFSAEVYAWDDVGKWIPTFDYGSVDYWLDLLTPIPDQEPEPKEPEAPTWNGEGFPPAGTVCEYAIWEGGSFRESWGQCVVKYTSSQWVVIEDSDDVESVFVFSDVKLMPLRTEKQRAIDNAMNVISAELDADNIDGSKILAKAVIGALYDAGLLKECEQ